MSISSSCASLVLGDELYDPNPRGWDEWQRYANHGRPRIYREREVLRGIRRDPIAGAESDGVSGRRARGWRATQCACPVAVINERDPAGQRAALA